MKNLNFKNDNVQNNIDVDSMANHILKQIEAANKVGIKTFTYTSMEEVFDVKSEFLDIK